MKTITTLLAGACFGALKTAVGAANDGTVCAVAFSGAKYSDQ
jgi:hypothetical protein